MISKHGQGIQSEGMFRHIRSSILCKLSLTIIGMFLVATAFHDNPHHATGTDGALLGLLHQPYGRTLLGAAGLGLITFGVFSAMCARWMRTGVTRTASYSHFPYSSSV